MCCGKAFWKKVVAFGLTFGLGVFFAGLFISAKFSPAVKPPVVPAAMENKNCVPVDENLKYERLANEEKNVSASSEENSKLKVKKSEDKEKNLKAEPDKPANPAEPQYYEQSKDSAEIKDLVHEEKCFETPVQ